MRLPFATAIGILCAGLFLGFGAESAGQQLPNLVVFIADDLGFHDTQPYGSRDAKRRIFADLPKPGSRSRGLTSLRRLAHRAVRRCSPA